MTESCTGSCIGSGDIFNPFQRQMMLPQMLPQLPQENMAVHNRISELVVLCQQGAPGTSRHLRHGTEEGGISPLSLSPDLSSVTGS